MASFCDTVIVRVLPFLAVVIQLSSVVAFQLVPITVTVFEPPTEGRYILTSDTCSGAACVTLTFILDVPHFTITVPLRLLVSVFFFTVTVTVPSLLAEPEVEVLIQSEPLSTKAVHSPEAFTFTVKLPPADEALMLVGDTVRLLVVGVPPPPPPLSPSSSLPQALRDITPRNKGISRNFFIMSENIRCYLIGIANIYRS